MNQSHEALLEEIAADSIRWDRMFLLLSLDVARPFYTVIGLPLMDDAQESLVKAIRTAILSPPVGSTLSAGALEAIKRSCGTRTLDILARWALDVFLYTDAPFSLVHDVWASVLLSAARDAPRWAGLGLPPEKAATLKRWVLALRDRGCMEEYEERARGPWSDWDLRVALRDDFADGSGEEDLRGLMLQHAADVHRSEQCWQWVVRALLPGELRGLIQQAEVLLRELPEFGFVSQLPPPALLAAPDREQARKWLDSVSWEGLGLEDLKGFGPEED